MSIGFSLRFASRAAWLYPQATWRSSQLLAVPTWTQNSFQIADPAAFSVLFQRRDEKDLE